MWSGKEGRSWAIGEMECSTLGCSGSDLADELSAGRQRCALSPAMAIGLKLDILRQSEDRHGN